VSDAEYGRFARQTGRGLPPNRPPDANVYPVVSVSWHDALAFTRWLSRETGLRYRLPSEAEWEYAAAAGTTTPYWWGFKVGAEEAYCHGCGNHLPRAPGAIGRFNANPYGLFDSAGNVLEWVQDCYFPAYEGASADGAPRETDRCEDRVARGGGFGTPTRSLRTTKRFASLQQSGMTTSGSGWPAIPDGAVPLSHGRSPCRDTRSRITPSVAWHNNAPG
jgi:formylglycine-generating enzyme required for sulfatase activity